MILLETQLAALASLFKAAPIELSQTNNLTHDIGHKATSWLFTSISSV